MYFLTFKMHVEILWETKIKYELLLTQVCNIVAKSIINIILNYCNLVLTHPASSVLLDCISYKDIRSRHTSWELYFIYPRCVTFWGLD